MVRLRASAALAALLVTLSNAAPSSASCPVPALFWGTTGSALGQFIQPFGIAISDDGLIYVTDQFNGRVQVFTGTGVPQFEWAIPPGPNGLSYPTGICISNGVVWVTSNQGQNVSRWTTAGAFLGVTTVPPLGWGYPTAIIADAAGDIYVCDSYYNRIVKLSSTGLYLSDFPTGSSPYGIDIDASGNIYVGCYDDHTVYKYDSAGNPLLSWGGFGNGPGQFYAAEGIVHDAAGDIYVCDTGNDRIQKFSPSGTYICEFGMNGIALGEMDVPSDIAIDQGGDIFVVEYLNNRIQRFTFGPTPAARTSWGSMKALYRR